MDRTRQDPCSSSGNGREVYEALSHMDTDTYKLLRPLLISLQAFGMFVPSLTKSTITTSNCHKLQILKTDQVIDRKSYLWLTYDILVNVLLWSNLFKYSLIISWEDTFGPTLFKKLAFVSWYVLSTLCCTSMLWVSLRHGTMHSYCLYARYIERNFCATKRLSRSKMMTRCILIGWMIFVANVVACIVGLSTTTLWDTILFPFNSSFAYYNWIKAISIIIHAYFSAAWIFPSVFVFINCRLIYHELALFNRCLTEVNHVKEELPRFRSWHQHLCHLLEIADNMITLQIGLVLWLDVTMECLLLNNLFLAASTDVDITSLVVEVSWVVLILLHIGLFSFATVSINKTVRYI